ncbi:MAG: beta-lactamase family protein [Saprospiraceae bacterium]|nr:beta-lactamase family protein [Saprospiraceae bacterium]
MKKVAIFSMIFLGMLPLAAQSNLDAAYLKTEAIMQEIADREDIVGVSITIGQADSISFTKGYGWVDKELRVKTQPYHRFRVYSLSKHITAIAAAKLAEDGVLDLDQPISTYIPFIDVPLATITSRQLIGHTSGIRSYQEGEWQKVSNGLCVSPFESLLSFEGDSLLFVPGGDYAYTSFGYVLLSAVIEKVAKKPFMDYLSEDILQPLGISSIRLDEAKEVDYLAAKPYEYWKGTLYNARYANNSCKFGGGGLLASTLDIVAFNQQLLNGSLVSAESLQMIYTSMRLNDGSETAYGFGLQFDVDEKGRSYAWHSGRSRGGRNALVIYPDQKLIVCISANTNGDGIVIEAETIAKSFLP